VTPRSHRPASAGPRHGLLIGVGVATAVVVVALAVPAAMGDDSADSASSGASTSAVTDSAVKVKAKPRSSASPSAKPSPASSPKASPTPSEEPAPEPSAEPESKPARPIAADDPRVPVQVIRPGDEEPIPATPSSYAKNVPEYPPDGRTGRRIVYSKALMHVWIVNSDDEVVRHYPVTGRWDRPAKGVYTIYSMSQYSENPHSKVNFKDMVRFAWGTNDESASIGFHSIPVYYADNPERGAKAGDPMHTKYELGLPVAAGGCIRQADEDADFLYRWAEVGDVVVVLPTAD